MRFTLFCCLVSAAACGSSGPETAIPDAGAAPDDVRTVIDAVVDAGVSDASLTDASLTDAPVTVDAFTNVTDASPVTSGCTPAGPEMVLEGNYAIQNSLDVTNLQPYTKITGNLTVTGQGGPAVSLPNLREVDGYIEVSGDLPSFAAPLLTQVQSLSINADLTDLDLACLGSVTSFITITNTQLENLDGLSHLAGALGNLTIEENDELVNVDGLAQLTSVGTAPAAIVNISMNPKLTSVGLTHLTTVPGLLAIIDDPLLTDLAGLSSLTSVGGSLDLPATLQSLHGLENLESVGGYFDVLDFNQLTAAPLPRLQSVGSGLGGTGPGFALQFKNDPELASLDLSALTSAGSFNVEWDPLLPSLDLPSFTTGSLTIDNDDGMVSISMPAATTGRPSVDLSNMPVLTTIDLGNLVHGGALSFSIAPMLVNLDVHSLSDVEALTVNQVGLTSLEAPLLEQAYDVAAEYSPFITTIDLPMLTSVTESLTVRCNDVLPMSVASDLLAQLSAAPVEVIIDHNDLGANYPGCEQ